MDEPMTNDEARKRYETTIKGAALWIFGLIGALLGSIFGYGIVAICVMVALSIAAAFVTYDKAH